MRLSFFNRKLPKTTALFVVVIVLWVAFFAVFSPFSSLSLVVLSVVTFFLLRPDLRAVFGASSDPRPWLVRLREHEWRPVTLPGGRRVSRSVAYLLMLIAWWWVLS